MNSEHRYLTSAFAEFIKARGIKQRWLADQVDVNEMQVSRWVRGISTITEVHAQRVASVLGVPMTIIFPVPFGTDSDSESEAA